MDDTTVDRSDDVGHRVEGDDAAGNKLGSELVEEELLVEEISIDGMCGVY